MNRKEFSDVRRHLARTQSQMARLLGVSLKGIQSFEQGWRGVSPAAEHEVLVLLGFGKALAQVKQPCWSIKKCPKEIRLKCPAWEFGAGNICWCINGTLCQGKAPKRWDEKAKVCRKCEVFQSVFDLPQSAAQNFRSMKNARSDSRLALSQAQSRKLSNRRPSVVEQFPTPKKAIYIE